MKKGFLTASLAVILTASAFYPVSMQEVSAANESNKNEMQAFSKDNTYTFATANAGKEIPNNISDVIVVQDDVPYYEEQSTDSAIIGELKAGDKIKMYAYTPELITTEIDGVLGFVETRFIDLSTSKLDKNELNDLWGKMRDLGITPAGKYTGNVQTPETATKPTETTTPSVKKDTVTKTTKPSENKDTVTYVYLDKQYEDKFDPYRIKVLDYNVIVSTNLNSTASTSSTVLATIAEGEKLKVSSTNDKFVLNKRKSLNEWLEVMYNGQKGYVKRQDISTNYKVYISPSASTWNYNRIAGNGGMKSSYYPGYNSGSYVTINNIAHDPIYDLLDAGTSVLPSAVTNSSILKPKAGTGASTITYIPSTGTASGDGWKAPTFTKNYESGIFKYIFAVDLGFRNTSDHFGVVFETTDGSRLDVFTVDPSVIQAFFEIKGLTKKESYRTKEMLKVVIPFFLDKSISNEGAKIHKDFIAYIESGSNVEKVVQYKGIKAKFVKSATDTYELWMY